jgi:hypothetical protein
MQLTVLLKSLDNNNNKMSNNIKYLTDAEKIRLKLLEDEIYMLNHKVERTLKKRDRLQREVKDIKESATKTEI